eukprot:CAMPEP_0194773008 /NCGR_PEP_ID=MMETSP0323_2-20130528/53604_1 /TAXON_ID=2866 ORGANISM="Crypthecodinium cohnii, Strain Seligo" /NCGR_SAMPLE_ID=MMETSP0323_2 /ASSEMBLY_ACC=CAM_ASM_000346 /LENGTH=89 /DNA_ID=CAMNT_0039707813 /DNA_START=63 /DNA_END=332 /DNA_ORIENTATION=-
MLSWSAGLLGLDARVDVVDEEVGGVEGYRSESERESVSHQQRVEEEEDALQESGHASLEEEVDAIQVEKYRDCDSSAERAPPPSVVLCV